MRRAIIIAFFALAAAIRPAMAAPDTDRVYARVVSDFVVPGFRSLAEAAEQHAAAWKTYCAAPAAGRIDALKDSFNTLADRWAGIELVRSGPAADDFRLERFYFWPERKNAVERGIRAILDPAAAEARTPEGISQQSAAVQGLPAIERLLFANEPPGTGADGAIRCAAGEAIAVNAARLASAMRDGWVARAGQVNEAGKAALATDFVTALAIIKDTKIEAVIGKEAKGVKPRAAEFWRSGRPVRNIVLNLEALRSVAAILVDGGGENAILPFTLGTAADIAGALPPDLAALAASPERSRAVLLRDAVDSAEDVAISEIPAALGVTIGFNSLDGD